MINLRKAGQGQPMGVPLEEETQSPHPGVGLMASYMQNPPPPRENVLPIQQVAAEEDEDHYTWGKQPGAGTRGKLVDEIVSIDKRLDLLMEIRARYKPQYLVIQDRMKMGGRAWWEKADGDLTPHERQEMEDYSKFQAASAEVMSTILKELAGAAVSGHEEARIKEFLPNSGTGYLWFMSSDNPTKYQGKLDRFIASMRRARFRTQYFLEKGLPHDSNIHREMPLFELEAPMWTQAVKERGQAYMDRGMTQEEAAARARHDLGIGDDY